jgi:hypothetical protein
MTLVVIISMLHKGDSRFTLYEKLVGDYENPRDYFTHTIAQKLCIATVVLSFSMADQFYFLIPYVLVVILGFFVKKCFKHEFADYMRDQSMKKIESNEE